MGAGALLDHIGGYVDPLRLVQKIPAGLQIPDLRDRLVHIIADFRTQTSLREGCNNILHHDCLVLAQVTLLHHTEQQGSGFRTPTIMVQACRMRHKWNLMGHTN